MKKWRFVAIALTLSLAIPLIVGPAIASATDAGLSPGYWKNHVEDWPTEVSPDDPLSSIHPDLPSDITILDALNYKGNKNHLDAMYRQLAAFWLNAWGVPGAAEPSAVVANVVGYLSWVTAPDADAKALWEEFKDKMDEWNNKGI